MQAKSGESEMNIYTTTGGILDGLGERGDEARGGGEGALESSLDCKNLGFFLFVFLQSSVLRPYWGFLLRIWWVSNKIQ